MPLKADFSLCWQQHETLQNNVSRLFWTIFGTAEHPLFRSWVGLTPEGASFRALDSLRATRNGATTRGCDLNPCTFTSIPWTCVPLGTQQAVCFARRWLCHKELLQRSLPTEWVSHSREFGLEVFAKSAYYGQARYLKELPFSPNCAWAFENCAVISCLLCLISDSAIIVWSAIIIQESIRSWLLFTQKILQLLLNCQGAAGAGCSARDREPGAPGDDMTGRVGILPARDHLTVSKSGEQDQPGDGSQHQQSDQTVRQLGDEEQVQAKLAV